MGKMGQAATQRAKDMERYELFWPQCDPQVRTVYKSFWEAVIERLNSLTLVTFGKNCLG